jgi:hypothetical protein
MTTSATFIQAQVEQTRSLATDVCALLLDHPHDEQQARARVLDLVTTRYGADPIGSMVEALTDLAALWMDAEAALMRRDGQV